MASKKAEMIVEHSHALMYDAIHEQIKDLLDELKLSRGWKQGQVNNHKFKVGHCVRVCGVHNGYVVRVTAKFVFSLPNQTSSGVILMFVELETMTE
jgi:hypothetical protein